MSYAGSRIVDNTSELSDIASKIGDANVTLDQSSNTRNNTEISVNDVIDGTSEGDLVCKNSLTGKVGPVHPINAFIDNNTLYIGETGTGGFMNRETKAYLDTVNNTSRAFDYIGNFANGDRVYIEKGMNNNSVIYTTTSGGELVNYVDGATSQVFEGWAEIDENNDELIVLTRNSTYGTADIYKYNSDLDKVSETSASLSSFNPSGYLYFNINSSTLTLLWHYGAFIQYAIINKSTSAVITDNTNLVADTALTNKSKPIRYSDGTLCLFDNGNNYSKVCVIDDSTGVPIITGASGSLVNLNNNNVTDKVAYDNHPRSRYREREVLVNGNDVYFMNSSKKLYKVTYVDGTTAPTVSSSLYTFTSNHYLGYQDSEYIYIIDGSGSAGGYITINKSNDQVSSYSTISNFYVVPSYLVKINDYFVCSPLYSKSTSGTTIKKLKISGGFITTLQSNLSLGFTAGQLCVFDEFIMFIDSTNGTYMLVDTNSLTSIGSRTINGFSNITDFYSKHIFIDSHYSFKMFAMYTSGQALDETTFRAFPIGILGAAVSSVSNGSIDMLTEGWGSLNSKYSRLDKSFDHTGTGNRGYIIGNNVQLLGGA